MNKEEILQKAITKAEENGFKNNLGNPEWIYSDKKLGYFAYFLEEHIYEAIIFSHSFAKAFWGNQKHEFVEESNQSDGGDDIWEECWHCKSQVKFPRYCWQYHLQQMVLEENPLEYLAKFLKGK